MNLIIDIGNTRIKAGLFDKRALTSFFYFTDTSTCIEKIRELLPRITQAMVCTVVDEIKEILEALPKNTLLFKSNIPIPITNKYATQHTLGSDRLAAAVGAYSVYPNQHCLVIDAGTCIKYNMVTLDNEYIGGAISPGLQMRFKALHQFTNRLPLIDLDQNFEALVGDSTQNSILSGVINGSAAEIDGMINRYKEQFPGLITVITGGDGDYFAKRLKNHIFAEPYLILKGLNEILIYNNKV